MGKVGDMSAPAQGISLSTVGASAIAVAGAESDALFVWLKEQLETLRDGMRPDYIMVGAMNANDNVNEIARWEAAPHSAVRAYEVSAKIRRLTADQAQIRAGVVTFAVQLVWPDTHIVHVLIRVDGGTKHSLSNTEPATTEGLTKQLMRHLEVTQKLATQGFMQSMEVTERIIMTQQQRIETLEQGRFKVLEMAESLMNAQAERNAEMARAAASEQRKMLGFQQLMDLAPIIKTKMLEAITGQKLATEHPAMNLMRSIFDGLTMEQVQAMLAPMPPEKQVAMLEIYRAAMAMPKPQPPAPTAESKPDAESPPPSTETH